MKIRETIMEHWQYIKQIQNFTTNEEKSKLKRNKINKLIIKNIKIIKCFTIKLKYI